MDGGVRGGSNEVLDVGIGWVGGEIGGWLGRTMRSLGLMTIRGKEGCGLEWVGGRKVEENEAV